MARDEPLPPTSLELLQSSSEKAKVSGVDGPRSASVNRIFLTWCAMNGFGDDLLRGLLGYLVDEPVTRTTSMTCDSSPQIFGSCTPSWTFPSLVAWGCRRQRSYRLSPSHGLPAAVRKIPNGGPLALSLALHQVCIRPALQINKYYATFHMLSSKLTWTFLRHIFIYIFYAHFLCYTWKCNRII